jgi:Flp pilus assembly protein TadD
MRKLANGTRCISQSGTPQRGLTAAQQAQQLDPLSLSMNLTTGLVLCFARQYDRAIDELCKVVEMDANFAAAHSTLGLAYTYRKMCDEAIAAFNKASALTSVSEAEWSFKALIACCYATCGRSKQAKSLLREVEDLRTSRG